MSIKSLFFGQSDEITNADAVRLAFVSIGIGMFLAYFFGPFEYSFWGLTVKAATFIGMVP